MMRVTLCRLSLFWISLSFFCVLYVLSLTFYLMSDFRVATINSNGARNCMKRVQLYELSRQKRLNVVFLQETHSEEENTVDWAVEWNGTAFLSHNTSVSGGVAILFSKGFAPLTHTVEEVIKGTLLKVRATFEDHVFVFVCVYAPTKVEDRITFLNALLATLLCCSVDEFLVVGGDFNCTEQELDRNHAEPHTCES